MRAPTGGDLEIPPLGAILGYDPQAPASGMPEQAPLLTSVDLACGAAPRLESCTTRIPTPRGTDYFLRNPRPRAQGFGTFRP